MANDGYVKVTRCFPDVRNDVNDSLVEFDPAAWLPLAASPAQLFDNNHVTKTSFVLVRSSNERR